jgi:hypothetical protein
MTATRILWLTWPMFFSIYLFVAPSNASADASLCGKWASVSGWKGEYSLTGSGSINYGSGATATVNYSSSATLHLATPSSQGCPSSMLQWAALMNASNATGSASYKLTVPCIPNGGTSTETWSTSQVAGGSAELLVDPTQGSLVFYPELNSTPLTVTAVGCGGSTSLPLPGVAFNPVLQSQMPAFKLPATPSNPVTTKEFSVVDGQTGITVNWTLSFTFTPDCDVPTGEVTAFADWDTADAAPTVGLWKQTLVSNTGASFAGLMVNEVDAGSGVDTCWFRGSAVAPVTTLMGNGIPWNVQDDNTWAYDNVGWTPPPVTYYQLLAPRAPCGFTLHQQMQITCWDGSQHNYGPVNTLQGIIGENDVSSIRASGHASKRTH